MRFFQNTSIRRKQMLIMMLIAGVALMLACAMFAAFEMVNFRKEMVQNLTTLARIVGDNTAAALDFNDAQTANEALLALKSQPHIVGACVYSRNGDSFATYQRSNYRGAFKPPAKPRPNGYGFGAGRLALFEPITAKGDVIGVIYLESDMQGLQSKLAQFAVITTLVLLLTLLVAFVLSARLQRLISEPILDLVRTVRAVAQDKNYSIRAAKRGTDEIGVLIDRFNEMLFQIQQRDAALQSARNDLEARVAERTREVEATHKQLVEASRRGGMAEVATNVLHNVGNVLNSVNISTGLIVERVRNSQTAGLAKVVELLGRHKQDLGHFITEDSRGHHLPIHLAHLSACLTAEQTAITTELDSLRRNVEHIKEIVAMQQNYATADGVKELINVVELVEDGMRINERGLRRHGVEVLREFGPVPPLNAEKHKILQVLVNLISNAKYACGQSGRADKRLTVRVANGDGRVRISVADNGIGIPPENMTRIFNHGFTTRKDGHGFGLHGGALAAREMGGSLTVQSPGPGHGATFTLELPCPTQEETHYESP
jgi:two-component system, NtrC family, sensor kinase